MYTYTTYIPIHNIYTHTHTHYPLGIQGYTWVYLVYLGILGYTWIYLDILVYTSILVYRYTYTHIPIRLLGILKR